MVATEINGKSEVAYIATTPLEHRKKFAQFFTPYRIAKLMSRWVYSNRPEKNKLSVLEPAIGLGIFSRILIREFKLIAEYTGYDIDDNILNAGKNDFLDLKIDIKRQDYISNNWSMKYDCIICNPPYFKFHNYDNTTLVRLVNENTNSLLSGFTNIYALFIIKSIYQLEENGCAAYIVPSEFLNSDYGKEVKRQILLSGSIAEVIVFDFDENVFEDALTTSCILLIKKTKNEKIRFYQINTLSQLDLLEEELVNKNSISDNFIKYSYSYEELLPEIKWRNYYQDLSIDHLKNIVSFRKYCQVKRGIATGSNEYFVFNKTKAIEFNISHENLLPCVSKGTDIKNLIFTPENFDELVNLDKPLFLVDLKIRQNLPVVNYIKLGEDQKVNERFLTKNRSPWYALENKKPADLWVGVFNRDGIKIIWNKAKILNLTTFHGIFISPLYVHLVDVIFAFLNTKIAKKIFEVNRREYGNGLNKFEPNDFNNSLIFDFALMAENEITLIKKFVKTISENTKSSYEYQNALLGIEKFFESKIVEQ